MTGYTCPVEGCDYGDDEEKSLAAVRSHINSTKKDENHDWEDLKPQVEAQGEGNEEGSDAPEEGDDQTDDGEDQDPTDEQTEPAENAENDPHESDTMASREEYEEQHSTDEGTDGGDEGSTESDTGSGGISWAPKLTTTQVALLLGVTAIAVFLYVKYRDDSGGNDSRGSGGQHSGTSEAPDGPDEVDTDEEDPDPELLPQQGGVAWDE